MQRNGDIVYFLLGVGFTSTRELGNFILRSPVLRSSTPADLNANCVHRCELNSRVVAVVKSPDIGSAQERARNRQYFVDHAAQFLRERPQSPHVFLFAVRYNERVSAEDMEMVQFLKTILGENVLRDHTLVVLTGGGDFERDHHDTGQQTILGWINRQPCENLRQLVAECGGRVQLFGDRSRFEDGLRNQMDQLLRSTDRLSQATGGRGYTREEFDRAASTRLRNILNFMLENEGASSQQITQKDTAPTDGEPPVNISTTKGTLGEGPSGEERQCMVTYHGL
ncbi:immune-associated nucleotide-binding protein 1 [Plakobranchus ocellatus]|uniref:Immune-associated nucleotide-binding protein 1 n=1 Tax=Plakobranchus ocellatus TaxID=259542 RepID=A0AAV4DJK8_9GAST|nr:immune-associated nucleotide-binding protein 1 [Plakobranchus ocellatus]